LRVVDLVGSAGAREMLMLATELDGATALAWGFINELTTADQLDSRVNAWTTRITTLSGYSQRGIKATLRKIREGATADDDETRHTFRNAFESPDFMAAAVAFTNNRKS
jgi:enoyl-CoA hydratase/carnithine racemase